MYPGHNHSYLTLESLILSERTAVFVRTSTMQNFIAPNFFLLWVLFSGVLPTLSRGDLLGESCSQSLFLASFNRMKRWFGSSIINCFFIQRQDNLFEPTSIHTLALLHVLTEIVFTWSLKGCGQFSYAVWLWRRSCCFSSYWLCLLVVNLTLTRIIGEEGLLIKICLQVVLKSLFNILDDTAHGEKCHYKLVVSAIRNQDE